jgi:hypothetical protein
MTSIPVTTSSKIGFDLIQTFYADSKAVQNSTQVSVTSIELFFKNRPDRLKNTSGIKDPGVTLWMCEFVNNNPVPARIVTGTQVRLNYNQILVLADASSATKFLFTKPVVLPTNKKYGICVKFDDNGFQLWTNKVGDRLVGTNTPSPGSTSVTDHVLYIGPGESSITPGSAVTAATTQTTGLNNKSSEDLKFNVNVAKYLTSSATANVYNKAYEFLDVTRTAGSVVFRGGEKVYKDTANATGTLAVQSGNSTITGTSTLFDTYDLDGKTVTIYNHSTSKFEVYNVGVRSNTSITVSPAPAFTNTATTFKVTPTATVYRPRTINKLTIFADSTATNTSFRFAAGDTLVGTVSGAQYTIDAVNTWNIHRFVPRFNIRSTSKHTVTLQTKFAYYSGAAWTLSGFKNLVNGTPVECTTQQYKLLSRSAEIATSTLHLPTTKKKCIVSQITMTTPGTNPFEAPTVNENEVDIEVLTRKISANADHYQTVGGVEYDKEVGPSGNTLTKYVSKKITFANNRFAEDIKVFLTAYRPENTDIRVYCRVHNSADPNSFENKSWSPLECTVNADQYSAVNTKDSLVEFQYGLPAYSETANTLPGTFTTTSACNVILTEIATTDPSAYLAANDVVRVYSPLFPNNYQVAVVTAANSTAFTIGDLVSNNNVIGKGFVVDKVKYPNIAFNNPLNDNICRYYNNDWAEFDKFDTMQLKIVLTAEEDNIAPEVTQYQFIGVSA